MRIFAPGTNAQRHYSVLDDYKGMIIRMGGKAMGRSEVMPPWEGQLSDQEINDLLKYLKSILKQK
jgi:mono/diheme cytochrome c family protein